MPDRTYPPLSPLVAGLRMSPTIAIQQRCDELAMANRPAWRLGLGQSPFPVPAPVVEALRTYAHVKDYLPPAGLPALRDAAAQWQRRRTGTTRLAEDIIVAPGSKELMFLTQVVFDGELLIPTPAWVSYAPQARTLGRSVVMLPTRALDGYLLEPNELERYCAHSGPRARMLILNTPSNPTGNAYSRAQLEALAEVMRRHKVVALSDEIYADLMFDGTFTSMASVYPEGTIVSTGLSKWCGAGGWRLGIFSLPPGMSAFRDTLIAVASETYTSTSAPIQYAAVRALQPDAAIDVYLAGARTILQALCGAARDVVVEAGASCVKPCAAFYLFADFEARRAQLAARGISGSADLATRLLDEAGVATLPGVAFGRPAGELTLRLSLVNFDGAAALAAVERSGATEVGSAFLDTWCAPTMDAVRALARWIDDGPAPRVM